jgi:DNA-binding transcriptional MerR regulator
MAGSTAELLSIGDFSRMTFLTVKALRHYQQVGLLEPARTDPSSGYRYYRPEQVADARLIRRLRDLDLPVDDVRTVLRAPDEQSRNAVMVEHLDRMSKQLEQVQDTVDSLRRMLSGEGEDIGVTFRDEPAQLAIAIRGEVDGDSAVSWWIGAFTELHRLLRTAGLERTGPDGAEFPTEFFTEGAAELLAFVPVDRVPSLAGRIEAVTRPAVRYAVALHDGPMVDLDGAYSALGRTVVERATATDGPVVERYLPLGDEDDLLAHHTEVCWPVSG